MDQEWTLQRQEKKPNFASAIVFYPERIHVYSPDVFIYKTVQVQVVPVMEVGERAA